MKIWVDADACPRDIKELIERAAYKRQLMTIFVSNKILSFPESKYIKAVKVELGPDVADDYIAQRVETGDIVITQDIPLASTVISKGANAISLQGELFTDSNIGTRLSMRNFMQDLRDSGLETGGPKRCPSGGDCR